MDLVSRYDGCTYVRVCIGCTDWVYRVSKGNASQEMERN